MLTDIVVDTNVLVHAGAEQEPLRPSAVALLNAIQGAQTLICVDEGFDLQESKNRSVIGHEYLKHLRFGSLGLAFVAQLAANGRVKIVSKAVGAAVSKQINQRILNKKDRSFLRVTLMSVDKVLASHDYTDFTQSKRDTFCAELGANVCSAAEALPLL